MKPLMIGLAVVAAMVSGQAFAQASTPASAPANADATNTTTVAQAAANPNSAAEQVGGWVAPDSLPGKTRAQVYQEMVHAQQDGETARLNATLYAH
ncbi:MAG TPA: hypothetical protein VGL08_10125 [Paraburkholderia sp.]|jgi:hypothetical protein